MKGEERAQEDNTYYESKAQSSEGNTLRCSSETYIKAEEQVRK